MSDDLAFIRAVQANPDDDAPRLVYADWLDERGDRRGEFLRLEIARHRAGRDADHLGAPLHRSRAGLDPRWLALVDRPQAGWRVVRTRQLPRTYGKAVPAFIHNGTYFYSPVEVYADGAINCWGFVDRPLFRGKLAEGWVVPRAAVGGTLGIHNLGQARVRAAEWDLTPADLERQVEDALRDVNPTLDGLLDMHGTDTEVRDGMRYAKLGLSDGRPYRVTLAGDEVPGAELPVFEAVADGYRLRPWLVYADGLSQLGYATELLPLESVAQMLTEGRLTLSVPDGAWVVLDGLGRFRAGTGHWYIEPGERVREASDLVGQLGGGPGAIRRCGEAHHAYEADPSDGRREALRAAYAAVPEHLRMFCGDMDSKDGPIRRILFGPGNDDGPD